MNGVTNRMFSALAAFAILSMFGIVAYAYYTQVIQAQSGLDGQINAIISITSPVDMPTNHLPPDGYVDVTISIDDNAGFASMILRLHIPHELELVGMYLHPGLDNYFQGPEDWDEDFAIYPPVTNYAFAGWVGRTTNFAADGDLITYRLRVRDGVALGTTTTPIRLSFANARPPHFETPLNLNGQSLRIFLPGGAVGFGAIGYIGSVVVSEAPTPLLVSVTPHHRTIVNRAENSVSFKITVTGMPPNYTMPIRTSVPIPGQAASITVENVPTGIEVSGAVVTDANGNGTGALTLTIIDPVLTPMQELLLFEVLQFEIRH